MKPPMVQTRVLEFSTRGDTDVHDLTPAVSRSLEESGVRQGLVSLFTPSSTSSRKLAICDASIAW